MSRSTHPMTLRSRMRQRPTPREPTRHPFHMTLRSQSGRRQQEEERHPTAEPRVRPRQTARRGGGRPAPQVRPRQTARRGGGRPASRLSAEPQPGPSSGEPPSAPAMPASFWFWGEVPSPRPEDRPRQTARRGGARPSHSPSTSPDLGEGDLGYVPGNPFLPVEPSSSPDHAPVNPIVLVEQSSSPSGSPSSTRYGKYKNHKPRKRRGFFFFLFKPPNIVIGSFQTMALLKRLYPQTNGKYRHTSRFIFLRIVTFFSDLSRMETERGD